MAQHGSRLTGIAIARSLEVRNEASGAAGLCVPKWLMNAGARDLPNTPNERSRRQGYSAGWSLNTLSVTNEGHLARTHECTDNLEDAPSNRGTSPRFRLIGGQTRLEGRRCRHP